MGSGKTTVVRVLAEGLGYELVAENFSDNVFLPRFYKDMKRWAFHSQTFFLMEKLGQLKELALSADTPRATPGVFCHSTEKIRQLKEISCLFSRHLRKAGLATGIVQDTPIEQDVYSYAKTLKLQGKMHPEEYRLYKRIYRLSLESLPVPDYYIYLKTDIKNIVKRIEARRREYEKSVPLSYLKLLEKTNETWLARIPAGKKIVVETDRLDFSRDKGAQKCLVEEVMGKVASRKGRESFRPACPP